MPKPHPLDDPTVRTRLASELPRWTLREGAIERVFKTANWKGALMLATTIGHFAEAAWHHPDLVVSYGAVTVRLSTHNPKGITNLDFALAAKIEEVVDWRPDAPLTGTPDDPRHSYLKREG